MATLFVNAVARPVPGGPGPAGRHRVAPGWKRWLRRVTSAVGWAFVLVCTAVAAVPLYGQITGSWRLLPVLSGSMAPAMVRGDLAWVEPKPLKELSVGDVLVFNSPARGSTPSRRVIHRVIEIVDPARIRSADLKPGTVYVRTKGDANPDVDPWIAGISSEQVWVRTNIVPELGRPLLAAEDRRVRTLTPLLAAALLAGWGASVLLRKDPDAPVADAEPAPVPVPERAHPRRPQVLRPALVGVAAVAMGLAGVSAAVSAALYDREVSVNTVGAGSVSLAAGPSTLSLMVSDLLPGDKVERVLDLTNDGTLALGAVLLEVGGDGGPLLSPAGGLQLEVARCPQPWETTSGPVGGPSARCPSAPTTVVSDRPLLGRTALDRSLVNVDEPGGVDHLRLTIRLPESAAPSLAGQRSAVTIAFLAGQRSPNVR